MNKFNCYDENSVISSSTLPLPSELKDEWPRPAGIHHIGHGSAVFRAMQQRRDNKRASLPDKFSLQEQWSMWMEDYIGRYIYFPLKWGYACQDMASDEPFQSPAPLLVCQQSSLSSSYCTNQGPAKLASDGPLNFIFRLLWHSYL